VKRILAGELLALVATEPDPLRKRRLILQAAPVLASAEAEAALLPLLGSDDAWLRRAALSGLVAATRRAGFVELAALDVRRFLETTPPRALIRDPRRPGNSYDARHLLGEHYPMLRVGWSPEDRVPEFLPLWRAVATTLRGDATARWSLGLRAVAEVGTKDDLPLLWAAWEETPREEAMVRRSVLHGIARLLGVTLPDRTNEDFLAREDEDLGRVRAAVKGP
jgi:hypothetical protein